MSYNILAQDLVEQGPDLYLHCQPDILNWNYRLPNILQEIQHWDPDVSTAWAPPCCVSSELEFLILSNFMVLKMNGHLRRRLAAMGTRLEPLEWLEPLGVCS